MCNSVFIKSLFSIVLLAAWHAGASAQVEARVEWDNKGDYSHSYVESLKEKGALLLQFAKDSEGGQRYLKISHYDTGLKLIRCDSFLIDKHLDMYSLFPDGDMHYSVLRRKNGEMAVVAYNVKTGAHNVYESDYSRKAGMYDEQIHDGKMVFSVARKNQKRVGILDLASGEIKHAEMHFKGVSDSKVDIIETTVVDGEINSIVRLNKEVSLFKIDMQGNIVSRTTLNLPADRILASGSVSKTGGKRFLTGTYGDKPGRSQGIYFAELGDDNLRFAKFYNFLELKNFTDYMSERGQKKAARRMEKAKKKGKEYTRNYLMAGHDIIAHGGAYYYLGEAYYPTYTTIMVGNVVRTTFSGYAYTHAVLAKFDADGNMLWDNCFEMAPHTKPYYVKRFVSAGVRDGNMSMLFGDGKKLFKKVVSDRDGSTLQERESEMLATDEENEDVKRARSTNTQHWFGDSFLVYGNQIVKNKQTGERRNVAYINKYVIK
ncbi:MAG: hypothetical protein J6K19_01415 [Prevotella sp.]|nr:hypothetical protein [Prevotella sp.]